MDASPNTKLRLSEYASKSQIDNIFVRDFMTIVREGL